jgi:Arc/MetJ-type ribon-helix-helix transcriptional regulator
VADENASDAVSRAVDAALANAALEGIDIPDDERALIEAHQRGELSDSDFLARARAIAQRKAGDNDG